MQQFTLSTEKQEYLKDLIDKSEHKNNLEAWEFGIRRKNFINSSYKNYFYTNNTNIKKFILHLTHMYNDIVQVFHEKEDESMHPTLAYGLNNSGVMYELNFSKLSITIHYSMQYITKEHGIYDGARFIDNGGLLPSMSYWMNCTLIMFYLIVLHNQSTPTIFLNPLDNPIQLKKLEEPIYSYSSKEGFEDVLLPFPDIWMHFFGFEFSKSFTPNDTSLKERENKVVFRGSLSFNNDDFTKSVRLKAHFMSNHSERLDLGITNSTYKMTNAAREIVLNDFNKTPYDDKKLMSFRYILHLDGFASAWRIIREIHYKSILLIHDSKYTDMIRESLTPNVHFIPVKNLFLLEDIISDDSVYSLEILEKIRCSLIEFTSMLTLDTMMKYCNEKIHKKNYNYKLLEKIDSPETQNFIIHPKKKTLHSTKITIGNLKNNTMYSRDLNYLV